MDSHLLLALRRASASRRMMESGATKRHNLGMPGLGILPSQILALRNQKSLVEPKPSHRKLWPHWMRTRAMASVRPTAPWPLGMYWWHRWKNRSRSIGGAPFGTCYRIVVSWFEFSFRVSSVRIGCSYSVQFHSFIFSKVWIEDSIDDKAFIFIFYRALETDIYRG